MINTLANEVMEVLRRHGVRLEKHDSFDRKHTISGFLNDTYVHISISFDAMDSYAQDLRLSMHNEERMEIFLTKLVKRVYQQCDGNSIAIDIVNEVINKGKTIYPYDGLQGLSTLQVISKIGLHGDEIAALYVYFCKHSVARFIALFRAVTVGYIHERDIMGYVYGALMGDDQYAGRNHLCDADMIYLHVKRYVHEFDMQRQGAA